MKYYNLPIFMFYYDTVYLWRIFITLTPEVSLILSHFTMISKAFLRR